MGEKYQTYKTEGIVPSGETDFGKPIIYGLNPLYRQIAKNFAEDIKSDSELGSKVDNLFLYGSVAKNKPNPSDIDVYIEAEPLTDSDFSRILKYKSKSEKSLRDKLRLENMKAYESGYAIELNIEMNKPLLWEQVVKWGNTRVKL